MVVTHGACIGCHQKIHLIHAHPHAMRIIEAKNNRETGWEMPTHDLESGKYGYGSLVLVARGRVIELYYVLF